jgi:YggT family protein
MENFNMSLIGFIVKAYIVVLLLRWVLTQQELTFNMIGRGVSMLTRFFAAGKPKATIDRMTPVIITVITFIYSLFFMIGGGPSFIEALIFAYKEVISFILMFFIVCVLLGALATPSTGSFPLFFYRLGNIWVKIARKIFRIKGNAIIIPTIIIIALVYIAANAILWVLYGLYLGEFDVLSVLAHETILFVAHMNKLLWYLGIIIVIRALLSWVSPDPRNILVQLIHYITEPVLSRFRRIVPQLGMIDLSAMVAIILIFLLNNIISLALSKLMMSGTPL